MTPTEGQTTTEAGVAKRAKPMPITKKTRWQDSKGRTWQVLEHLHFGRYFCALADRHSYHGEWTAKDIRSAVQLPDGEAHTINGDAP